MMQRVDSMFLNENDRIRWSSSSRLLSSATVCLLILVSCLSFSSMSFAEQYAYVHGLVVDEQSRVLSDVQVQFFTSNGALVASTSTNSDGFFNVMVAYGTYNLYVTKTAYAKTVKSVSVQWLDTDLGNITLNRALKLSSSSLGLIAKVGDTLGIPFTVANVGADPEIVDFLITKPEGWPARILDQNREVAAEYLSPGQSLNLELEVAVPSTAPTYNSFNLSLTAVGTSNCSLTFTVWTRPQPTASVSGKVVDEDGKGIGGADVAVYSSEGCFIKSVATSSNGDFDIELPASATFSVDFIKEGYTKLSKNILLKDETLVLGQVTLSKSVKLYSSALNLITNPGAKLLIPFTISNAVGGETEAVSFLVTGSRGWLTRVVGQTGTETLGVTLSPGASLNLQLEVTVPFSVADRNLTLTAVGRTNSSLQFSVKVQQSEAKVVSCQFPGKSVGPGEMAQFQVRVKNPADVEQQFTISTVPTLQGWSVYTRNAGGEAVSEVTLEGGGFVDLLVSVLTPTDVSVGNYTILFSAKSPNLYAELPLVLSVQKSTADVKVEAKPPYVDVYAGSDGRFKLSISNLGGYDELLDLSLQGLPSGLRGWFEDSAKQEITKVYVEKGQTNVIYVAVSTPKGAKLGAQNFTASLTNAGVNKTIDLTLNILGLRALAVTNQNFYTSLYVGGQGSFTLAVSNSGSQELTNVKAIMGAAPDGFSVTVEPSYQASLGAGQDTTFDITVKAQSDVNAGNYYINFNVMSDQTEPQSYTLRVEVLQETNWIIYAGILIVVALIMLLMVYRRFGRR